MFLQLDWRRWMATTQIDLNELSKAAADRLVEAWYEIEQQRPFMGDRPDVFLLSSLDPVRKELGTKLAEWLCGRDEPTEVK
jgi:hypothetical protein